MGSAIDYNRRRYQAGDFTADEVTKLVYFFQKESGFTGDDLDGKFGPGTEAKLDGTDLELEEEKPSGPTIIIPKKKSQGPKGFPTPTAEVWDGWIYPMPLLYDS